MDNRFPHGASQLPGMIRSSPGSAFVGVAPAGMVSGPYRMMPQQYYQTMPTVASSMMPNEMQQGMYRMTVHPGGHAFSQHPYPAAAAISQHPRGAMSDEQRQWLEQQQGQIKEKLTKERDYQKQQQRLREFSVGGGGCQKLEADKLIENMFGALDDTAKRKQHRASGIQNVKSVPRQTVAERDDARPGAASGFHASQKARDWSNLDDLHNVFSNPNASVEGLPAWCQAGAPVPPVYTQVESYVTRNGMIDTSLLYPVLVSSGLSRETLGQIWSLANRRTPGLLDQSELYAALALVALAQNACQITSIELLHSLNQAPVPLLNQVATQQAAPMHPTPDQADLPVHPTTNAADDEFDDFKSATHDAPSPSLIVIPPPASLLSGTSIGSRLAHYNLTHSPVAPKSSEPPPTPTGQSGTAEADEFTDFQQAFASTTASATTVPTASVAPTPRISLTGIPERSSKDHEWTVHGDFSSLSNSNGGKSGHRTAKEAFASDPEGVGPAPLALPPVLAKPTSRSGGDLMGACNEDKYSVFRTLAIDADGTNSVPQSEANDDFGDFLSGGATLPPRSFPVPRFAAAPASVVPAPVSDAAPDFGAFHPSFGTQGEPYGEFSDFQSAAPVPSASDALGLGDADGRNKPVRSPAKPSPSLSSLISNLHGFHFHSAADDEDDDDFGDFMAPCDGGGASSGSNSVASNNRDDSRDADQLSSGCGSNTFSKSTPSFESQSVSSLDFVTGDASTGAGSEAPHLGRHGSVPSLDLKVAESPEQEEEVVLPENSGLPVGIDALARKDISDTYQQPMAPVMVTGQSLIDRYSLMRGESKLAHADVHSYEWQRCLDNCHQVIGDAFKIFNGISNSKVSNEVIESEEGENYLKNIVEIYRISRRISISAKRIQVLDPKIGSAIAGIEAEWNKLLSFVMGSPVFQDEDRFNFSAAVLDQNAENAHRACGICLLDVDSSPNKASCGDSEGFKLDYGGRQYHSACANFWVNFVDSLLPSLASKRNLL